MDTFRHGGLLLARDFTHLDHDALVSLGVTATGHRKRILRLVAHIQKADLPRDRCQSVTYTPSSERGDSTALLTGSVNFEVFRNNSVPNLATMLTGSDSRRPAVKPVPKPRTVFNRRRTAPVHFCPTPEPAPPPPRRLSQESICFTVLEGLSSGDTPTVADFSDLMSTTPCRRSSQAGRRRPSRSLSLTDAGGGVPPVPPRMNRGAPPAISPLPSSSSSSSLPVRTEQNQALPVASGPGSPDGSRSPCSSPGGREVEMVSNDIYWGTSPGSTAPGGAKAYCSKQPAPPTPPRQPADRNPERNR